MGVSEILREMDNEFMDIYDNKIIKSFDQMVLTTMLENHFMSIEDHNSELDDVLDQLMDE